MKIVMISSEQYTDERGTISITRRESGEWVVHDAASGSESVHKSKADAIKKIASRHIEWSVAS